MISGCSALFVPERQTGNRSALILIKKEMQIKKSPN
jgi:hypothetical protein